MKKRGFVQIKVGDIDKNHLIKFANYMQDETQESIKQEFGGAYTKDNTVWTVRYNSRQVVNNLKKFNLFQAKSGKEIPFKIDNPKLKRAYVRGMIDGDGCIRKSYLKYVGSYESCKYIKDYFGEWISYKNDCKYILKNYEKIYSFELRRKSSIDILYKIYANSTIFLDRKYEKVVMLKSEKKTGKLNRRAC